MEPRRNYGVMYKIESSFSKHINPLISSTHMCVFNSQYLLHFRPELLTKIHLELTIYKIHLLLLHKCQHQFSGHIWSPLPMPVQWNLYPQFPIATFCPKYRSFLLALKNCPKYNYIWYIMHWSVFYCIKCSEFFVLIHNIPRMIISEENLHK